MSMSMMVDYLAFESRVTFGHARSSALFYVTSIFAVVGTHLRLDEDRRNDPRQAVVMQTNVS